MVTIVIRLDYLSAGDMVRPKEIATIIYYAGKYNCPMELIDQIPDGNEWIASSLNKLIDWLIETHPRTFTIQ